MKTNKLLYMLLPAAALGLAACDVTQTEEGKMPEVDVDVKEGKMPSYDVDAADIDIEKKEVTVPTLDYESPAEDEAEQKAGTE